MEKLLILGGTGLVGSTLIDYALQKFQIHITNNQNENNFKQIPSTAIDFLTETEKLINFIKFFNPDYIVHTVAFPSVDFCETNHEQANLLHVKVTKKIALASKEINAKLIFLSTDAVFNGKKNKKFVESDIPNPINFYGKTKLKAEKNVLSVSNSNVVLRTAVIYGWHKKSRFTNWILSYLKKGNIVEPVIDQYNTPTLIDDLVTVIIKILKNNYSGLFHATGKSCINRYEFALKLAEHFNFNLDLIKPVTSKQKKQLAPRPEGSCLNSSKLENLIQFKFKKIDEGIKFILKKSERSPWEL